MFSSDAANGRGEAAGRPHGARCRFAATLLLVLSAAVPAQSNVCIVKTIEGCTVFMDFYSARFTAYQPDFYGEQKFCNELPGTGTTIFTLNYLHRSLKEVPVDFRIIRDATGQGRFASWEDVERLGDLEPYTVFYRPPEVRPDETLLVQHQFTERGEYLAVISAGHPTSDRLYRAVFPITIGRTYTLLPLGGLALLGLVALLYRRERVR